MLHLFTCFMVFVIMIPVNGCSVVGEHSVPSEAIPKGVVDGTEEIMQT